MFHRSPYRPTLRGRSAWWVELELVSGVCIWSFLPSPHRICCTGRDGARWLWGVIFQFGKPTFTQVRHYLSIFQYRVRVYTSMYMYEWVSSWAWVKSRVYFIFPAFSTLAQQNILCTGGDGARWLWGVITFVWPGHKHLKNHSSAHIHLHKLGICGDAGKANLNNSIESILEEKWLNFYQELFRKKKTRHNTICCHILLLIWTLFYS